MEKKIRNDYPEIQQLPSDAQKVSDYAKENNISIAATYKRYKAGKIKIVTYKDYNWIIK